MTRDTVDPKQGSPIGTPVAEFLQKGKREEARRAVGKAIRQLNDALVQADAAKLQVRISQAGIIVTSSVSENIPNEDDLDDA